jgi:NAD(P)-dependent dehydrogenase (short-subunit alcohol dehydrogenase family)
MRLRGAHVLLTGGTRGIGRALAGELAAREARLSLVARNAELLADVCEQTGAAPVPADLSDPKALAAVTASAERAHGGVDILINNAAISIAGPLGTLTADDLRMVLGTNLLAPLELTRQVLDGMRARQRGRIVNISSLAGDIAMRNALPYGASKAGLTLATSTLQRELRGTGVHAQLVVLGLVDTDFIAQAAERDPFARASTDRFAKRMPPLPPSEAARRIVHTIEHDRRRNLIVPALSAPLHAIGTVGTRVGDLLFAGLPASYPHAARTGSRA